MSRRTPARGFTLLELMVACTVVGILATVAIPAFTNMNQRAKAAERAVMVRSIRTALNTLRVKEGSFGTGILLGDWNPTGVAGTTPRAFAVRATGWNRLDLQIEGTCYYSYQFTAEEAALGPYFLILVHGNVDGDSVNYDGAYRWDLSDGAFIQTAAPDPNYDDTVF